uniref:Protein sleepless n=1 Tax=Strigamia maritima TaxID=126957 RepID=T1IWU5_STRMM
MKWLFISFVAVLTFCLIFTSVFGRTCYVCDTYKDPIGCRTESLNDTYLKSCEELHGTKSNVYFCRKINQYVEKLMGVSDERVVRQCGWEETTRACYNRAGFGSRLTVCTCYEKDGCNSAAHLPISWILIMTTAAASLSLRHLL